jgi:hypothetical protein
MSRYLCQGRVLLFILCPLATASCCEDESPMAAWKRPIGPPPQNGCAKKPQLDRGLTDCF